MDVLVVIVVIALLMGLLAPSLSRATEAARRVVCASNLHQIGLGLSMWVSDHDGALPPVAFADGAEREEPAHLLQLAHLGEFDQDWDGLGMLVAGGYIGAPSLFYCPSHRGENPFQRYKARWSAPGEEIVVNYHYRWLTSGQRFLDNLHDDVTLVSDGIRSLPDFNHGKGANMLKADMRVAWFEDDGGRFAAELPLAVSADHPALVQTGALMAALDVGRMPEGANPLDESASPFVNSGTSIR